MSVSAVRRSQKRKQRLVLRNRQRSPVAQEPPFHLEVKCKQLNLSQYEIHIYLLELMFFDYSTKEERRTPKIKDRALTCETVYRSKSFLYRNASKVILLRKGNSSLEGVSKFVAKK